MRFLLLFLVIIPAFELWLLVKVADEIGALFTIALLFGAAILGINIVRYQGVSTLMNMNQQLRAGQVPARAMAEGMMLGVAGVLFIIPGFGSDFLALLLLTPVLRRWILSRWLSKVQVKTAQRGRVFDGEVEPPQTEDAPRIGRTLEGEFERKDDKTPR